MMKKKTRGDEVKMTRKTMALPRTRIAGSEEKRTIRFTRSKAIIRTWFYRKMSRKERQNRIWNGDTR